MGYWQNTKLPLNTARAVLAARPTSYEISALSTRTDIPREALRRAAPHRLTQLADQQDGEAVGMLRHPHCPQEVVLRYLLARSAGVRIAALTATKRRNLPVDSALIRAARDLPMTDPSSFPCAKRVRAAADQIFAAR